MTETEILKKRDELLIAESSEPEQWWWLSFCDPNLPEGSQFLGVSLVKARGFITASVSASLLGINPGGEVQGFGIPDNYNVPESYRNRLLTCAEAETLDANFARQNEAEIK